MFQKHYAQKFWFTVYSRQMVMFMKGSLRASTMQELLVIGWSQVANKSIFATPSFEHE